MPPRHTSPHPELPRSAPLAEWRCLPELRTDVTFIAARRVWQCKTRHPKSQFSVKVGTIFEDSPLSLSKWLPAVWMISGAKNGISSYEIHRALGVTQKTAWFMLHRIRLAMQDENGGMLGGEVEVDEAFIGGKARNMHEAKRREKITGTGGKDKTIVLGMVERGGKVRASVVGLAGSMNCKPPSARTSKLARRSLATS